MKLRFKTAVIMIVVMVHLCALPALAADQNVTMSTEYDEVVSLLLDDAPHMCFDASQTNVKFQVSEELQGKTLKVYDFRSNINMMINNVEDVTVDEEGYVTIHLPSTGAFVVADLPYDASRIVPDLRYLDKSLWSRAKTPSEPFDTDICPIPQGDWVGSVEWREKEGLEPYETLEGEEGESDDQEGADGESDPEGVDEQASQEPVTDSQSQLDQTQQTQAAVLPVTPQPEPESDRFPLITYLVVAAFIGLGVIFSMLFHSR